MTLTEMGRESLQEFIEYYVNPVVVYNDTEIVLVNSKAVDFFRLNNVDEICGKPIAVFVDTQALRHGLCYLKPMDRRSILAKVSQNELILNDETLKLLTIKNVNEIDTMRLLESTGDAVVCTDSEGVVKYANDRCLEILEMNIEAMLGSKLQNLMCLEDRVTSEKLELPLHCDYGPTTHNFEVGTILKIKSGVHKFVNINISSVHENEKNVLLYSCFSRYN